MIDTKEKLKHCLAVEKNIYFPGGGEDFRLEYARKMYFTDIFII